jgi:hypothetical protein
MKAVPSQPLITIADSANRSLGPGPLPIFAELLPYADFGGQTACQPRH